MGSKEASNHTIPNPIIVALLTIATAVFAIPVYLTVISVAYIARSIIILIARIKRPDLAEIYTDKGILFATENVYKNPRTNLVIHLVCDGTVPVNKLRNQFQILINNSYAAKVGSYAHLYHRWTTFMGYAFWQYDKDFDLKNHVRAYDYTEPELLLPEEVCTEEDLRRVGPALISRPYVEGRSPWEVLVVPNYRASSNTDGHQQSVMVLRIHHALIDGISIVKLLQRLLQQEQVAVPSAKFAKRSPMEEFKSNLFVLLTAPYDFVKTALSQIDGKNCWHGPQLTKKYHLFWSDPIPVERIKAVMRKHKVNFNAVIYSVTGGAITKMMKEVGQEIPEKLSTFYPFPLPDHPGGLVNHVTADVFSFHPRKSPSALERLQELSQRVKATNDYAATTPVWLDWSWRGTNLLPLPIIARLHRIFGFTLVMTNIPGPEKPLNVLDSGKIVEIIPTMGSFTGPCGAIAIMMSIGGKQRIGLSVDRALLESTELPTKFPVYVQEEIDQLLL